MAEYISINGFDPNPGQEIPDVMIHIHGAIGPIIAQIKNDAPLTEFLAQAHSIYDLEAEAIFQALRDSLPGGTLDRLVGKLIMYKASHFTVSYQG